MHPYTLNNLQKPGVDKAPHKPYTKKCIPTHSNVVLNGTGENTYGQNKNTLQYVRQVVSVGKC
jgi:hypothetical protein